MSDAELRKIHDQNKSVQAKLSDLRFEHMLAVRAVLTPEQRNKMYQLKQDRKEKFKTRRGKMRDRMNDQE
ncbi:MAG: hypothetical protein COX62_02945 [Deltaproteobacteria bacterium CG_4_10_14_0_2_um_filter_43_8]|nr:MAG: hypothetical protein COV43_03635 [Deltaproteobacteria bacterium CG11_big_fil_rev_8_21_14_0_20_42_23]PJA21226.1 MAG: hypothetical protein COX62_02945 [Deltaproteobacteria bacterium CG_4_10_14_0_2_um_filter_43_8]PJC64817.1 MAG: hypothetical protein CO021_02245 [Deltaproteobacteria bacterium CG_4_9_14_0_2_um_filter_42_21]